VQVFLFLCVRLIFGCLRLFPEWMLYALARCCGVIFFDVFRLARKRVLRNLRQSFPGMNPRERVRLARSNYIYIAESGMELIKSANWSVEETRNRLRIENPELIQPYLDSGKSVVVWMGHQTNVDMTSLLAVHFPMLIAYSPIQQNRPMDLWVKRLRSRMGARLISSDQIKQELLKNKMPSIHGSDATLIELIADHRALLKRGFMLDFFDASCPFFKGPELIARRQKLPMFYLRPERTERGRYSYQFIELDAPSDELGARTQQAVNLLQDDIVSYPHWYLWMYNMFKHSEGAAFGDGEHNAVDEAVN
jgi:Kdo2-lipid IVA lauroyltransferase/acyltransferase